ncbi:MAG: PaaI family thioesterase [Actinomycetota bacterium]
MALHRLSNQAWGFESSCFVCEHGNESGMRIAFFHDDEAGLVVADYSLGAAFSGTPNYVHGGATFAVLDEAMAWAAIALGGVFALTRTSSVSFLRPVKVGAPCRVEARVERTNDDGTLDTVAEILDPRRRPCARSSAVFVPIDAARARAAIGDVGGDDARFVRG